MKAPPPGTTPRKVHKLRLDAQQHVRRHETSDALGISISEFREIAVKVNQLDRVDPIEPSKRQQRAEATLREAAVREAARRDDAERRLHLMVKMERQIRKTVEMDALECERQEAVIMRELHDERDKHFLSSLELRGDKEILQKRVKNIARVASAARRVRHGVCALGKENAEGEADSEEYEEMSDEGSQADEQDTPPLDPALSPSRAIAVPGVPVVGKVASPPQVAAVAAAVSTDSVMVHGRPLSPPRPESSVVVSPTITPAPTSAPTGHLSPELDAAPSAPGAARVLPVSSEPELSSHNAELEAPRHAANPNPNPNPNLTLTLTLT